MTRLVASAENPNLEIRKSLPFAGFGFAAFLRIWCFVLFFSAPVFAQTNAPLIGCDAASGTDSGEEIPIFGIIQPQIVRTRADGWAAMEPTKGVYNWTRFDNMLMLNTKTNSIYDNGTIQVEAPGLN